MTKNITCIQIVLHDKLNQFFFECKLKMTDFSVNFLNSLRFT